MPASALPVFISELVVVGDTTPPVSALVSETRTRVSAITGRNSTDVTWHADEDIQAWQFRRVASDSSTVTHGTLIKQATGVSIAANADQVTTITEAELIAAGAGEGNNIIKLFVQDVAGNWSGTTPYSEMILATPNLQSYWRVDETSGALQDSAGSIDSTSAHGSVTSVTGLLTGDSNAAIFIDGSASSDVIFSDVYGFPSRAPFTIEFLCKFLGTQAALQTLFSKEGLLGGLLDGWLIGFGASSASLAFQIDPRDAAAVAAVAPSAMTTNQIAHYACTYDGTTLSVYKDGTKGTDATMTTPMIGVTNPLTWGKRAHSASSYATIVLDEIAIYNAVLDAATITEHSDRSKGN